jgi:hypothetical protein
MAVYVDELRPVWVRARRYGRYSERQNFTCRLFADSDCELETFRKKLGLQPATQHDTGRFIYYEITVYRQARALQLGAVQVTKRKFNKMFDRERGV